MFKRTTSRNFLMVGMFVIVCGAAVLAIGVVEWLLITFTDQIYGWPALKIIAGLAIVALGYIMLELELIRTKPTS